ncbi:MAG: transporter [Proteobacteria bacterium]|nr:transporter [Pseudomonadota bacterium]
MYRKVLPLLIAAAMFVLMAYSTTVSADHGALGFGIGTASPIITQTGLTLPKNMWASGIITQFVNLDSISDSRLLALKNNAETDADGDVHDVETFLQPSIFAAYGVTDDLTLGLRIPYVLRSGVRSPDDHGDEVTKQGDPSGFGDVSFFGQYRFYHSDDNLNHASLVVGLKTPTGETSIPTNTPAGHHGSGAFEAHHQPGGGAWSPSFGLSFTRAMGQFSFDTSVLYTVSTTGSQATDLGDLFGYNFAVSYAFGAPARNNFFSSSNNAPWTAVLELNGEWQDYERTNGERNPNSGGDTIFISPGIRYSGGNNWNTALSIGAPILTGTNGYQTDPDYRITYRFVMVF